MKEMVEAMQGWISIHRKIMENPVWQDPKLLKLWMLCLLEASHKEHEQLVGRQVITLQPGQFVTGRYSLAEKYNKGAKKKDIVPESTLWRWLKWFETNEFLNIKSTTKYSVITILNWDKYQQSEHQMNNKWTTNEHQVNTNNNGNNVNNVNNFVVDEDPTGNFERTIIQKYMQLAAIGGFDIPERDKAAVRQVINAGVPLDKALSLLEQCFNEYQPKHPRDKINSFSYCATYIMNKYYQEKEGANNVFPIHRRSTGYAKQESKPKQEPIFGDYVGRLPRRSKPL